MNKMQKSLKFNNNSLNLNNQEFKLKNTIKKQ